MLPFQHVGVFLLKKLTVSTFWRVFGGTCSAEGGGVLGAAAAGN